MTTESQSITLDGELLRKAQAFADDEGLSLRTLIEEALRCHLRVLATPRLRPRDVQPSPRPHLYLVRDDDRPDAPLFNDHEVALLMELSG